jgi:exodeoxyribonuclease VII large subunit
MARPSKNQWDFGELFPSAETRKVWSVTDLTGRLKRSIEKEFASLWVSGEISNWRLQSSGHAYFVLKDAGAQLNCVLFRGQAGVDRSGLRDGARVTVGGDMTVYEPRGTYQLRVSSIEMEGVGALQAAFEKLKARLAAEGLFESSRKRPIPRFPNRVAVVTSPTGAALQDVLHVAGRRFAGIDWILAPVRVQGAGSAAAIVEAIHLVNRLSETLPVDVILVTRGGGSLEDLWSFNEEVVARAIAASSIPVISAVGHEIDFTIADFVADLRAATPSAAAELLTEGFVQAAGRVEAARVRIELRLRRQLAQSREAERVLTARLARVHPRRHLEQQGQRLDDLSLTLTRRLRSTAGPRRQALASLARRLGAVRPAQALARRQEVLAQLALRLRTSARRRLVGLNERLGAQAAALRLLSPQQILERGYSITLDAGTGKVVRGAEEVRPGQALTTRVARGAIQSTVTASEAPAPTGL